jgi:uridine kinase
VSADTVAVVAAWVLSAQPTLGSGRLLCVDGPAGSGKTTLAGALAECLRDAGATVQVVHMDDVYAGWAGLKHGMATFAETVVDPLRAGETGRYRRYDWELGGYAEEHEVPPCDVLVVEGVGSGAATYDDAITCLVWVEAPRDLRLARGLARDGEGMRQHWLSWRLEEDAMFDRERTEARADLAVDGETGSFAPPVRTR